MREGGGGGEGGLEPKKVVSQKWPISIFPFVSFILSHRVQGVQSSFTPHQVWCPKGCAVDSVHEVLGTYPSVTLASRSTIKHRGPRGRGGGGTPPPSSDGC